jgi:hypothetical protein
MRAAAIAAALVLATAPAPGRIARAEPTPPRAAYLAELIEAIRGSDAAALANTRKYIQVVERNRCQAPEMTLRVGCLVEAAGQNCKSLAADARERCRLVSDAIATNLLAERVFVPDDVRYDLMAKQRDARTAIARELARRRAALVAELAMSELFPGPRAGTAALAASIDQFCSRVAGTRDLSWQYCAAAIAWFVATDGAGDGATDGATKGTR